MASLEDLPPPDDSSAVGRGATWFAVLPDSDSAGAAAARLAGERVERHASGRPWIVGRWAADDLVVGHAGAHRVAVFGAGSAASGQLTEAAARARDVRDLDRLAGALPGCFHLVASIAGEVRVQGALSGLRRVFHARVDGVDVAADRSDMLAHAVGADPALDRLAFCLLTPEAPYPFTGEVVWQGVAALPEDHHLVLDRHGVARATRWWRPPTPTLTLAEGAAALRAALTEAVAARVRTGRQLSSDLSGGMDSTPVCYLAATATRARGGRLVAVTNCMDDPDDDDPLWADLAARAMPGLDRVVLHADDLPLPYADLLEPGPPDEEPLLDPGTRWHTKWVAHVLRQRGVELHLTGEGGDEVLEPGRGYLRGLLWRNPRRALDHLRAHRAMRRWSWLSTLRTLAPAPPYRAWLAASADTLTAPPDDVAPRRARGLTYRMPPWATDAAADLARDRIRATAGQVRPLAADRTAHEALEAVRAAGRDLRRLSQPSARYGVVEQAPLLDDRVIETCLAVLPEERADPRRYKPLMVEAMRGLLPDAWLARQTKAYGTSLHHSGLRAHRAVLARLCEDSELARLGLVDPGRLRDQCTGMWTSSLWPVALSRTFGLERWLRDLRAARQESTTFAKGRS